MSTTVDNSLLALAKKIARDDECFPEDILTEFGEVLREYVDELPEDERITVIDGDPIDLNQFVIEIDKVIEAGSEELQKDRGKSN